ncbi:MAG: hypothetical protein MUE51_03450 [Thermoleophilia bacterium]|jgi:hypothetical protein|nr:hypothetical protein [Thermoleophilia bacterium]
MSDVVEVNVAGSWIQVLPGSFQVIPNPTAPRSAAKWFEFRVADNPDKVARGPVSSIEVMLSAAA